MRARVVESAGSLVVFTVLAQAAAGVALFGGTPAIALSLLVVAGAVVLLHLGRPGRARLATARWRRSWLSREVLLGMAFGAALVARLLLPEGRVAAYVAALLGLFFVWAIANVYRLRTVPAWDTWRTPAQFLGTAFLLGAAIRGLPIVAACFALGQVLLTMTSLPRKRRGIAALRVATALLGSALLFHSAWAILLLFASELIGRWLFYASHRRVGL